ncbi:helix-turn-helix domain-containing protein [Sphingomonas sp. NPDC092331]|jgi:transcriptional regulator with XRE-family HTH domain|uniref:helix-turn-helix domain-containing protein n=1 Tax=unclassified Sphingomonas TaxID=196159 RepID=UPI0038247A21
MDRSGGNAGSDIGVQLACGPGEVHYSCIVQRVIDIDAQLGARIRIERKNRGWSLNELAERAAISRAMVAKVEAGQSSPTANLLGKLSGAFGLTISTLMSRAESGQGRLVRWADQPVWVDPESGYVRRQVSPASDMPFDLVHVTLPAGARVEMPASAYAFLRQVIWVLEGELIFVEGGVRHVLRAGDCLELGPPAECGFGNESADPCVYVVALLRTHEGRGILS